MTRMELVEENFLLKLENASLKRELITYREHHAEVDRRQAEILRREATALRNRMQTQLNGESASQGNDQRGGPYALSPSGEPA